MKIADDGGGEMQAIDSSKVRIDDGDDLGGRRRFAGGGRRRRPKLIPNLRLKLCWWRTTTNSDSSPAISKGKNNFLIEVG